MRIKMGRKHQHVLGIPLAIYSEKSKVNNIINNPGNLRLVISFLQLLYDVAHQLILGIPTGSEEGILEIKFLRLGGL
ncbi:hypothetical protein C5167_017876 [Papaver somniferum]|uniref:Uncharacterized protein n=1 Tax=Papaver somniferum TaxID=3469 RepID=A0A4Y7IKN5_PAPSO|nr:hypothetical protein C5167_017876 [Papaver somniferum]